MDLIKRVEPLALLLLIIGGLNWGIIALFDTNVVAEVFSNSTVVDVIYVAVGVAALMFVPKLLDALHIGGHHTRPHGA